MQNSCQCKILDCGTSSIQLKTCRKLRLYMQILPFPQVLLSGLLETCRDALVRRKCMKQSKSNKSITCQHSQNETQHACAPCAAEKYAYDDESRAAKSLALALGEIQRCDAPKRSIRACQCIFASAHSRARRYNTSTKSQHTFLVSLWFLFTN